MRDMQQAKRTPGRSIVRLRKRSGRRAPASVSLLLVVFLLLAFLAGVAYASTYVYAWARNAARALPDAKTVVLPDVVLPAASQASEEIAPQSAPVVAAPQAAAGVDLPAQIQLAPDRDRVTVLLLGVDERPDEVGPPRTDTMMVLTADLNSGQSALISIPRDMLVSIPAFDRQAKINTAYVIGESEDYPGGGGALAKKTVSDLLGYPVDYYIKINFDGFVKAIDLIGGIDIDVPKAIHDDKYPTIDYGYTTFQIEAGPQHLDGETALKYARTRHVDDDFQRARRQHQVLLAVKDALIQNKLLTTLRSLDLLDVLGDSIEHDIPAADLLELATLATHVDIQNIQQLVLDSHYGQVDSDSPYGWVVVPDRAAIRPVIDSVFVTAKPSAPPVDAQTLARQQAEQTRQRVQNSYLAQAEEFRQQLASEAARILVVNGTGDDVLAAQAADWLRRQGYNVVGHGQADRPDYPRTVLLSYGDNPLTIANLRDTFGIAKNNIRFSADPNSTLDIRLIIGRDFYLLVSN